MRIMIKGGVWKNTEDEILKAAVMKYGLNQWARISSLLVRKSAKQCKARWYEWLDPSIKKTEWSQEEDERLLHMAKILPCQWRSIAERVGRTAAQCLERYEQLLDSAQNKDLLAKENSDDVTDSNIERRYDDPRRLRPGEIDPHPETKPARPDPVDMDEDEKEMLSEARARLANTKGKKAKRKAREKQLEEARRLASLQKKRELKAAGIPIKDRKKKKTKYIDYNEEIPFYRQPKKGFYDTLEDDIRAKQITFEARSKFKPMYIADLEGERRDEIEEKERKKDIARQKLLRKINLPEAIMRLNRLNDSSLLTIQRTKNMNLPIPQVSEQELEDIAKFTNRPSAIISNSNTNSVTNFLLNNNNNNDNKYAGNNNNNNINFLIASTTPSTMINNTNNIFHSHATPIITPHLQHGATNTAVAGVTTPGMATPNLNLASIRTPSTRGDHIIQQARNAVAMRDAQTPLLGGNDNIIHEDKDWNGVEPKKHSIATPNLLTTPLLFHKHQLQQPNTNSVSIDPLHTPAMSVVSGVTNNTNANNNLNNLNNDKYRKKMKKRLRQELESLPPTTNDYIIQLPQLPKQHPSLTQQSMFKFQLKNSIDNNEVMDASDLESIRRENKMKEESINFKKKSQVVQNDLPRPNIINYDMDTTFVEFNDHSIAFEDASNLLRNETIKMIEYDNNKQNHAHIKSIYDEFDLEQLENAKILLNAEVQHLNTLHKLYVGHNSDNENLDFMNIENNLNVEIDEKKNQAENDNNDNNNNDKNNNTNKEIKTKMTEKRKNELYSIFQSIQEQSVFIPSLQRFGFISNKQAMLSEKLNVKQQEFEILRRHIDNEITKNNKMEKNLQLLTEGYQIIEKKTIKNICENHNKLINAKNEIIIFEELLKREKLIIPKRIKEWKNLIENEKQKEHELQSKYEKLLNELHNANKQ